MEDKKKDIRKYDFILITDQNLSFDHFLEIGQVIRMTRNEIGEVDTYSVQFKKETVVFTEELAYGCEVLAFKE